MRFQEFVEDQVFSPALIADALRTTKSEIAGTLGLGKDAFTRASRIRARKTQVRLRQMLEILQPCRSRDRITARGLCLVSRRAAAGLRRRHAGLAGPRRQGRSRACLPRPDHGGRLCVTVRSPDAVPGTGLPGTQSAVVLDAPVGRRRASSRWALQPAWASGAPYLPDPAGRHT